MVPGAILVVSLKTDFWCDNEPACSIGVMQQAAGIIFKY
jgi:hypothetical protein